MKRALLERLADGALHSGSALGREFGVSRAAISKNARYWRELGAPIESAPGQGYRIPGGLELLERRRILQALPAPAPHLEIHTVLPSTNAHLLEQAGQELEYPRICLAETQTAGSGRRGRSWYSPFGSGIYLSLLWRFDCGAALLEGLSLAVAVATVDALQAQGGEDFRLKWPNDVQWRGRKLAGVLLEMRGDPNGRCEVVAGVGVNTALPPAMKREQGWTDLQEVAGCPVSRNRLAADLVRSLVLLFAGYEGEGFARWRRRWDALDGMRGREVVLHSGAQRVHGIASGVDENGALCLDTAQGRQVYNGGELSLRTVP